MAILTVLDLSAGRIERVEIRADGHQIAIQLTAATRVDLGAGTTRDLKPELTDPLTRFMAVLGRHLVTWPFDQALELASREDPAGYASYRRSLQADGGRHGCD